jgi:hypothetical protein
MLAPLVLEGFADAQMPEIADKLWRLGMPAYLIVEHTGQVSGTR